MSPSLNRLIGNLFDRTILGLDHGILVGEVAEPTLGQFSSVDAHPVTNDLLLIEVGFQAFITLHVELVGPEWRTDVQRHLVDRLFFDSFAEIVASEGLWIEEVSSTAVERAVRAIFPFDDPLVVQAIAIDAVGIGRSTIIKRIDEWLVAEQGSVAAHGEPARGVPGPTRGDLDPSWESTHEASRPGSDRCRLLAVPLSQPAVPVSVPVSQPAVPVSAQVSQLGAAGPTDSAPTQPEERTKIPAELAIPA